MRNYMKLSFLFVILISITSCKKENLPLRLQFTAEERQWCIYQKGQQFKFKNSTGDSLVYTVSNVEHKYDKPEYTDTSFSKIAALTETYLAKLENPTDSIIIYFYKESQFGGDPNRMKQTIRWISIKNQFVELSAIKDGTPFSNRMVNGLTYSKVTKAIPLTQTVYVFTKFDFAYYDQNSGFIEIIDLNGDAWIRQ